MATNTAAIYRNSRVQAPDLLAPVERSAVECFVERVLREVPVRLRQAALFGSKARGEARPDSDIDVLLVFEWLPWDREPYASQAEDIAEAVAGASGVPVTTWAVSLSDLEVGRRTPMLVDALQDSIPLWFEGHPLPPVAFTPSDALWCADSLLSRVAEGSEEFEAHCRLGAEAEAARRVRDDVVRLCTAAMLLRGITRPRRGDAVRCFPRWASGGAPLPPAVHRVLDWAATSFGPDGRDEDAAVAVPPGGLRVAARSIDLLRDEVERAASLLTARVERTETLFSMPKAGGHPACRFRDGAPESWEGSLPQPVLGL